MMGNNLFNGDCLKVMDTLIEKGVKVDLIVIDPPYEVNVTGGGGSLNKNLQFNKSTKQVSDANIHKGYDFNSFISKARLLQNKLNLYVWTGKKQIPMYIDYFVIKNKCLFDILIWNKSNAVPSYSNKYLTDNEYCLYFKEKGAYNKPQNYEDAKTVYLGKINIKDKKIYSHPTIKPLDFTEKIIRNSCPKGGLVLDCFMGSGTTGVACENLGVNFIGIEIDETYFNVAKERLLF